MVSDNLPDPGPLQPDAAHVVVGDLDYFLKAEHAWVCGRGQLIHGHGAQAAHKINWRTKKGCWQRAKKRTLALCTMAKNSQNVPVLGVIRKLQNLARLTYCITIQSGRTCEYPKAEIKIKKEEHFSSKGHIMWEDFTQCI